MITVFSGLTVQATIKWCIHPELRNNKNKLDPESYFNTSASNKLYFTFLQKKCHSSFVNRKNVMIVAWSLQTKAMEPD